MFNLRYYQSEAIAATYSEWDRVQSTAIIAATACGKTEMYLSLATEFPGRVLILAHRDYLLRQPIKRLEKVGFDDVAVEKAEECSEGGLVSHKIVFGSVQTLCKPNRLAAFNPFDFSVVIVDEGHRAVAKSYRTILDHFKSNPRLRVLILTATPKRKDGVALGNVCDSVAYSYGPNQAIKEGWIVPLRFYRRDVEGLDFRNVNMKGSDLNPDEVERLLMEEKPLHTVCASLAEDRGPTVVFCPGVAVSRAYATLMNNRYRPGRSAVLWADSTDDERELVGKQLAQGELDYLFNCDLVTEGYDVPELVRVVWAAPTASLVRFTQGTGRVFRTHSSLREALTGDRAEADARKLLIQQSPKPLGQVVTYYPQNCKHQLCEPNDILGGDDLDAETKAYAKQIQEKTAAQDGGSDPEEDVETAEAVVELRRLLDKKRKNIKAVANVHDQEYDAFGGMKHRTALSDTGKAAKDAAKAMSSDWPVKTPISPKQAGLLRTLGAKQLPDGAWQASVVISLVKQHGVNINTALSYGRKQGLAVLKSYEEATA